MRRKIVDPNLISCCWLYCKSCTQYQSGECPGCKKMESSPSWCTIRDCCIRNGYTNCTECIDFIENNGCEKFESMVIGCLKFLDGPERKTAMKLVKKKGIKGYIKFMSEKNP